MGIEPTNGGTTIRCLNPLATVATALIIISTAGSLGKPPPKAMQRLVGWFQPLASQVALGLAFNFDPLAAEVSSG